MCVAAGITIWLATVQTTALILFPVILLVTGLVFEWFLEKRREHIEDGENGKKLSSVGYYAIIGICGVLVTGWAVSYVQIPSALLSTMQLSLNSDALMYSVLMAVAEEQFFRGFITDGLLSQKIPGVANNPYFALVLSALIFMGYHWARYGTDPNALMYVFAGGFILSWIAYKSRRLSPSIISHVATNILAVVGGSV